VKNHRILIWVFFGFFLLACSDKYDSADNGFDKICLIYSDVMNNPAHTNRPNIEKLVLISETVEAHVRDVDAIAAYTAVASADPEKKYDLFKQAAEYSLKREWDCKTIQELQLTEISLAHSGGCPA